MSLRKAAEMALESWDFFFSQAHPEVVGLMYGSDWAKIAKERTEALRQALAQPEWVGLTDQETDGLIDLATYMDETDLWHLVILVEKRLKEKNT